MSPSGIWSDGTSMWVSDDDDDKLYAYKMSDKTRDSAKDFDTLTNAGNTTPLAIWSDGTIMWVSDSSDRKIYAYKKISGVLLFWLRQIGDLTFYSRRVFL